MVMTGRVHDMILDPKLTGQLPEVVAEGGYYGMQTFDQHLLKHLRAGRITYEEAMRSATSPHDFKLMVAAEGPLATEQAAASPATPAAPGAQPPMQATITPPAPNGPPPASAPPPGVRF
jgi:twitching motility protein PilT